MEELGLAFIDINLDKYKEARKVMIDRTSKKTVPQIFFNNYHVGGWTEFKNLVSVAKSKYSVFSNDLVDTYIKKDGLRTVP